MGLTMTKISGMRFTLIATALVLSGCVNEFAQEKPVIESPLRSAEIAVAADGLPQGNLGTPFVKSALIALETGDYLAAQEGFNRALKFEPANSQLHFLNGLTYHLRAKAGDSSQREFAQIGYKLALQYDPANYWAAYQMGHLNFNDSRYREAQDAFAYALLYAPEDATLLKALATASYYAQDLRTAATALARAKAALPNDPMVLRLSTLIHAAGGDLDAAKGYLSQYRTHGVENGFRRISFVEQRINDWQRFHEGGAIELAQSTSDILGGDNTTTGLPAPSDDDSGGGDSDSSDDSSSTTASSGKPSIPKMTMVDVVIIRSEERLATGKGVNLLSGLTLTLPTGTNTFNFTGTRTANDPGTGANTLVNQFAWNVPLQLSAAYSLNIFNDNNDHNEVLARPSLIALDGKKSEFFTGAVIHVEMDGVAGSQGTVSDVPIGIKLDITPKFIDADTVELNVDAARAFIENRSSQINFNNFAQITKTMVTANVAMKFDETLIISGLSEKETERLNDGVPFLQDIPGIQYLFSHEDTLDYTKSVLILMTPRKPTYTLADGSPKIDKANPADAKKPQPSLAELQKNPNWFKPTSNIDAVFAHLKSFKFFREFRAGDVSLEHWDNPTTLGDRIKGAVNFIYY